MHWNDWKTLTGHHSWPKKQNWNSIVDVPQKRSKGVNYAAMHSEDLDGYDEIYIG